MYTSINDIDKQLEENYPYFKKQNGFFIEAGANDGLKQSNTCFFETQLKWKGILIEPVPVICDQCRINRPNAIIENVALVADNYHLPKIVIEYTPQTYGLMSTIKGIRTAKHHLYKAGDTEGHKGIIVEALTLNQILEKHKATIPAIIDLMVLDVEGYEPEALSGIDFKKWHIRHILIEQQYNSKKIIELLQPHYKQIAQLSTHDYLWEKI